MARRMALQVTSEKARRRDRVLPGRRRAVLPPTPPYVSPTLRRFSSRLPESLATMLEGLTILRQTSVDYLSDGLSRVAGQLSGA